MHPRTYTDTRSPYPPPPGWFCKRGATYLQNTLGARYSQARTWPTSHHLTDGHGRALQPVTHGRARPEPGTVPPGPASQPPAMPDQKDRGHESSLSRCLLWQAGGSVPKQPSPTQASVGPLHDLDRVSQREHTLTLSGLSTHTLHYLVSFWSPA